MDNSEDQQPDPRIVKALEEHSEVLAQIVEAVLDNTTGAREAAEAAIAQGFGTAMELMLTDTPQGKKVVQVEAAPMSMVRELLQQIDQYLIDQPAASRMLNELRKPLASFIHQRVTSTRNQFVGALAGVYGKALAEMIVDGEDLTDDQRAQIGFRDMMSPMGTVDLLSFATQYHKMPTDQCRCLNCQRQAFNRSPLTLETAREELEARWPNQQELLIAYGQNRQDIWAKMIRGLHEGDLTEHFGVDGTPDPSAAQSILDEALNKMGVNGKKE